MTPLSIPHQFPLLHRQIKKPLRPKSERFHRLSARRKALKVGNDLVRHAFRKPATTPVSLTNSFPIASWQKAQIPSGLYRLILVTLQMRHTSPDLPNLFGLRFPKTSLQATALAISRSFTNTSGTIIADRPEFTI